MISALKAREIATNVVRQRIDPDDLAWLEETIEIAAKKGSFYLNVSMTDQMTETSTHRGMRNLLEYLKLNEFNAYYVGDRLEIKWQI